MIYFCRRFELYQSTVQLFSELFCWFFFVGALKLIPAHLFPAWPRHNFYVSCTLYMPRNVKANDAVYDGVVKA
jgi:hypothetical protein